MALNQDHISIDPPPGVPVWDVDPYDEALLRDPEPYYARLRDLGPFVYLSRYSMLACGRYAETREVFSDWKRFVSSRGVGLTDFSLAKPWRPPSIVLEVDPPNHTRTRNALAKALSPQAVGALKASFESAAERLVTELLERGCIDAVADVAEPFPLSVFPSALGLRDVDRHRLLAYGAMVFNSLGPDNALRRSALAQASDVVPWIMAQCAREQLLPGGFGATLYGCADRGELTDEEAGLLVRSLLSAGVDTTVTGIGNLLWCLSRTPEAWDALRDQPSLARAAFEEALRRTSPVHTFCRTSAGATEVGGVMVPADAKIACVLGAANLDPRHWRDPERFDVHRTTTGHMAFGAGIHICVGQLVARAEAEALLTVMARRVARIEPAGDAAWRPGNSIRTLDSLPLRLVPA